MFTNLTTQLAREQQRQVLAEASHHRRHRHGGMAPSTPRAATRIFRRRAAAITSAGVPRETAMRKVLPYALALPLIVACTAATCSCSSNSSSAVGPTTPPVTASATGATNTKGPTPAPSTTDPSPSSAAGLFAYVPASLQSSCTDTGTVGHFPAQISGYTNSLACDTGPVSELDEVDYYQYASTSDMQSAYGTASDGGWLPGGCASGSLEYGTWSTGGAAIGDISCPGSTPVALVWDDPNTNIIAVVKADYAIPSEYYDWWQSNGASVDGSSAPATSS
jgi:hypothetical protein